MYNNKNIQLNITIIGAGLCGLMMALYLAKRGYKIDLYEKASYLLIMFLWEAHILGQA